MEAEGFDPRPSGSNSYESRCPGHNGGRRNLTVSRGDDGRALLCCQAHGCDFAGILEPLRLTVPDLFPPEPAQAPVPAGGHIRNGHRRNGDRGDGHKAHAARRAHPTAEAAVAGAARKLGGPSARWAYHGPEGREAFLVFRFDRPRARKEFRPVHRTPDGWAVGDPPCPLPLYRLPEIPTAVRVYITEGEKAAD